MYILSVLKYLHLPTLFTSFSPSTLQLKEWYLSSLKNFKTYNPKYTRNPVNKQILLKMAFY